MFMTAVEMGEMKCYEKNHVKEHEIVTIADGWQESMFSYMEYQTSMHCLIYG